MSDNVYSVFAYGTLMFPAVMEALLGRSFASRSETIRGYSRHPVIGQVYPGILASSQSHTLEGVLWTGLSSRHLSILDDFEDDFYSAELLRIGDVHARFYVVSASNAAVLNTDASWSPEEFRSRHYHEYLQHIKGL
jgi:gamma-glutamylcyclotransferase (GGCT)/AIG2-like uncharacterized protein YtfP